jgi:hypothetical protein
MRLLVSINHYPSIASVLTNGKPETSLRFQKKAIVPDSSTTLPFSPLPLVIQRMAAEGRMDAAEMFALEIREVQVL